MLAAMAPEVLIPTSADEAASLYGDGSGITIFGGKRTSIVHQRQLSTEAFMIALFGIFLLTATGWPS